MVTSQPVRTFFNTWDLTQTALLGAAKTKRRYSIQAIKEGSEEALKELNVLVYPRDFKKPPYQFRYTDKAKDLRNPGRADFEMPIDDREDNPKYILAVFADDNKVNLENWQFLITWK